MKIEIPSTPQFLTDLILQRTGPFLKLGGNLALNDWFTKGNVNGLVQYLKSKNLISEYLRLVLEDFKVELNELKMNIPKESLRKIVSIGPGNGLLELLLLREGSTTDLLLIDIERTPEHYHGFNSKGSGYASLLATKNFLEKNMGVSTKIHTCNPAKESLPNFEYTLLVSILSMGFHYPCDEYADFIMTNSSKGSIVVFDKRLGVPDAGFEHISTSFSQMQSISGQKHKKVFLQKSV